MSQAGSSAVLSIAAQHIFDGADMPGYRADLVALHPNFEVVGTWIGGVGSMGEGSKVSERG
ncbi:hypothetical protein JQ596_31790 [Bradyrhizobium manausense]|uniref:hypothetical protein n=1 Tax=Bradyrhizobium TaxID=374 RepID=UPI001BAD714B|nr:MULTISPECIES: hypothetical protein [Bradyrhizobium]MBR0830120.1 hypothetical protein [Bradyrhizobium manausense]UVO33599.1 hypothetical protein KUF59_09810 [Bradyrhizobium arachidis]